MGYIQKQLLGIKGQDIEATLDRDRESPSRSPTVLNRTMAVKDTFLSVFPFYGVIPD